MASAPSPLPPGPGSSGPDPSNQSPTAPTAASPSPASPSPPMQQGTQMVIGVVSQLRAIAKAFPSTAEPINQINNLMRDVVASMMKEQSPGEPQAPPNM